MTNTPNTQANPSPISTLSILPSVYPGMLEHLRAHYPNEGCGILLRNKRSNEHHFHIFEPIPNTDQHPQHRFYLEPSVYIDLLFRYPEASWDRILVHSHPFTSATISREDILGWMDTQALWTGWLVVSFQNGLDKPTYSYYTKL
ncbi:Mov34/MPN/PAD-1 family protein [Paenibacillus arenosi]|uniref:Mov34/MPN/PAD-1 family protein n=1 Tax=Paenibacillus arenosi TaxID=2774142 RepID=A0ABR9AX20_9BACL|nr:Mov34/MPN/PAD-1 family protein [Paenibacillus arenosi]MBD8498685.1 Mov34/MPN/PAD-1 family protein [Paenibacillus arenosi]